MRLHDLTFGTPEGPARLDLHRHMTVLSGLEAEERHDFANRLFAALSGVDEDAVVRYLAEDGSRRQLTVRQGTVEHRRLDRPDQAIGSLIGSAFRDRAHLRQLSLIGPETFRSDGSVSDEPEPLAEARRRLTQLESELGAARDAKAAIAPQQIEVDRLRRLAASAADRRARAAWRAEVERVEALRSELGLHDGDERAERDHALVAEAGTIEALVTGWTALRNRLAAFEGRAPLDPATVETLLAVPENLPQELDERISEHTSAHAEVRRRQDDLRRLAAQELPEPSHPVVCDLARHDQEHLWSAHTRLCQTRRQVADLDHRLAGVSSGDDTAAVALMEEAHRRLVQADDRADRHLVPGVGVAAAAAIGSMVLAAGSKLLALALFTIGVSIAAAAILKPRLDARSAALAESAAANRTGASSYLGFHLRRLEASFDRDLRSRLEACELEHRLAEEDWIQLTGGIDAEVAAGFEEESRAYAVAVDRLSAGESAILEATAALRAASGALDRTRRNLLVLGDEYAIEDLQVDEPGRLPDAFTTQLERRQQAAQQTQRMKFTAELDEVEQALLDQVSAHGVGWTVDASSIATLTRAVEQARFRIEAREASRPAEVIAAELAEAERVADEMHQPHWDLGPEDPDAPLEDADIDEAIHAAEQELEALARLAGQIGRLNERVTAMNRRVSTLDASLGAGRRSQDGDVLAEAESTLQAVFTAALGPNRERLPLVFDDAFVDAAPSRKWDLLEMVLRLAGHNQVIYLTEDPYVTAWARTAAQEERISLLAASSPADHPAGSRIDASR